MLPEEGYIYAIFIGASKHNNEDIVRIMRSYNFPIHTSLAIRKVPDVYYAMKVIEKKLSDKEIKTVIGNVYGAPIPFINTIIRNLEGENVTNVSYNLDY